MGVLNVTPDSFSDGGRFNTLDAALCQAEAMVDAGADIIDIGGESTRPGSEAVGESEELRRVIPVIEALAARFQTPLSIDTSKPAVMQAAVEAGASMINDVYALRAEGALECAATLNVPICLMHMQGEPKTMQQQPNYREVVTEVADFLSERMRACEEAGISRQRLILDPGFGFGKRLQDNLALLNRLPQLASFKRPLLVGLSRKSMLGQITGREVEQRLAGSLTMAALALWQGANIIRVHDVAESVDLVKIVSALKMHHN
ncbi:dihydropteroate synthase [Ectothiorhodospiraceae bacterium BW-2]|nr:dihydropteroate synthase [Ectothiorhodospiraceae bacterium BW-2]